MTAIVQQSFTPRNIDAVCQTELCLTQFKEELMLNRFQLIGLAVCASAVVCVLPARAQTISQDYARYSGMLRAEEARTADLDRQDQSRLNNSSGSSSGSSSSGSRSSSSSSGSSVGNSIGMLSGTLGSMMDRHNASVANRQARDNAARAAAEGRERASRKASDDFLAAYERAHPQIQRNLEAAAHGDVLALRAAGLQYLKGSGVAQDIPKGLGLLSDAAARNDRDAQVMLAKIYSDGQTGVSAPKPVEGHRWVLALAESGDVWHMTVACGDFITGRGTKVDFAAAEKWCAAAMDKDDATSANNLGVIYSGRYAEVKTDLPKARQCFEKSVALDPFGDARNNLISLLGGQLGGEPDYDAVAKLYQAGAVKHNATDEDNLGMLYINGKGVPKDVAKGVEWFNQAIKDGSTKALFDLGVMYVYGSKIPKDLALGMKLCRQAAVQGSPQALFHMGIRTMNGVDGVQQDQIEGERLLHLAADNGDRDAPQVLGQIYLNGYGVDKDPAAARKWFQMGLDRGDTECADELKKMG